MKVLYFAWLRAKTGVGEETFDAAGIGDVAGLIDALSRRSPGHAEAFANLKVVRVAVNQDYVGFDHPLKPGDEVTFFPPVTGG